MATHTNVLSLCAGYGGIDLGLRLADERVRTVCYIEREVTVAGVLASRFEGGCLDDAPIWSDLKTFDGEPWRGAVDLIAAGYPCQPFSCAGARKGVKDPRHLWPDVARIIREVEPEWVFLENVDRHLRVGFQAVRDELGRMGYRVAAGLFSAEEVGAPHRRLRLFALAHTRRFNAQRRAESSRGAAPGTQQSLTRSGKVLAITAGARLEGRQDFAGVRGKTQHAAVERTGLACFPPGPEDLEQWAEVLREYPTLEPAVCRLADGTTSRVDELRALGNGVVPLVAAHAYRSLRAAFGN